MRQREWFDGLWDKSKMRIEKKSGCKAPDNRLHVDVFYIPIDGLLVLELNFPTDQHVILDGIYIAI
ncbi:hypothetical protein [Nitrosomonas marina]|uniref:Uncharacterized protein n=1 Tax=Nitrosomonas marina TaxID=917 RepID=A0A1H8CQE8_9PROT|nr:hypothetical protein [Nitrosomonas marina]SEM97245.1 hypothetical protein SAMN05216325_10590 [Nitrosomonas marina]